MRSLHPLTLLLAAAVTVIPGRATGAAVLHLTAQVVAMTDANATTGRVTDSGVASDLFGGDAVVPHDFKITYYAQVSGLTGNEVGFGSVSLNIVPAPGLSRSTEPSHQSYVPSSPTANDYGVPSPIFSTNGDLGSDTIDWRDITASIPAGLDPTDVSADDGVRNYRLAAINDSYVPIGSIWVTWSGHHVTPLTVTVTQWSVSVGNPTQQLSQGTSGVINDATLYGFGFDPEPTALPIVTAAAGIYLCRPRRQRV